VNHSLAHRSSHRSPLAPAALGLLGEIGRRLANVILVVRHVARVDVESAAADAVLGLAPHARAVGGEVGDVPAVLLVPRVAEERDAGNLGLGTGVELADDVVHDGGALRVAARDDDLTALGLREGLHALADGLGVRPLRGYVGGERGGVEHWVGLQARELPPERGLQLRTNEDALLNVRLLSFRRLSSIVQWVTARWIRARTRNRKCSPVASRGWREPHRMCCLPEQRRPEPQRTEWRRPRASYFQRT
jgi:hypothetical protein